MRASIHAATTIGPVHLTVRDLDGAVTFYHERLGFRVRRRAGDVAHLGAGGPDLLVLWSAPDAPRAPGSTGLYHFAILVPSRRDLAMSLGHLRATRTPLRGAADHLVSEALYLADPEGNGIEIYRDRPPDEWPHEHGQISMANDPLDLDALLEERGHRDDPWNGLPPGTAIGHIHLRASNLVDADRFYSDVLGFDIMQRLGDSALFLSAGGYHHHIALNTWAGVGAPPPPPGATGLRQFVVRLPTDSERDRVTARVRAAGLDVSDARPGYSILDPSGNRVVLMAEAEARNP